MRLKCISVIFCCLSVVKTISVGASSDSLVRIVKKYELYEIQGETQQQIDGNFTLSKPYWLYELGNDAYFEYDIDIDINNKNCNINDLTFNVTYYLPQLKETKRIKSL